MFVLKKYVLPVLVIIFSLVIINALKVVPSSVFFNGYDVFFASSNVPSESIAEILKESGCKDFIYLKNQEIPLNIQQKSPEMALLKTNLVKSEYLSERNFFFFDKNKSANIFYIPNEYLKNAQTALKILKDNNIFAGINAKESFPYIQFFILLVFSIILLLFSDKKLLMCFLFVPAIIVSLCIPFASVMAGSCIFELFLFFFTSFFERKNATKKILHSIVLLVIFGTSFICIVFSRWLAVISFLALILSEISIFFLYVNLINKIDNRYNFKPVYIRSAFTIKVITQKNRILFALCALCVFLIFITSILSLNLENLFSENNSQKIQIPSSCVSISNLPSLNDYVLWKWEVITFPYISINEKRKNKNLQNNTVSFKTYEKKDGIIQEKISYISYNDDFITNSLKEIKKLNYPALEKMLLLQKKNAHFGYAYASSKTITFVSSFLLIVAFIVPFIFYIEYKYRGLLNKSGFFV